MENLSAFRMEYLKGNFQLQTSLESKVQERLNDVLKVDGKRVRPFFIYFFGKICQLNKNDLATYAKAVEQTHAASLIHDDVIDNSILRREKETLNFKEGNRKAILAGDFLLSSIISELCGKADPEIIKNLADSISKLVMGEWEQAEINEGVDVSIERLIEITKLKTGSLFEWSCLTPLILAKKSEDEVEAIRKFSQNLSIAFQILDDLWDCDKIHNIRHSQDLQNKQFNFVNAWIFMNKKELYYPIIQWKRLPHMAPPWDEHIEKEAIQATKDLAIHYLKMSSDLFDEFLAKQEITDKEYYRSLIDELFDFIKLSFKF